MKTVFFLNKRFPPPSKYWCVTAGALSYFLSWVSHPYPASGLHMGLPNIPAQKFPASRLIFEGPHSEHSLAKPATSPPDIFWLSDRHWKPQRSTLTHRWWGPICTQLPLAACLSFPPSPISNRQAQTPLLLLCKGARRDNIWLTPCNVAIRCRHSLASGFATSAILPFTSWPTIMSKGHAWNMPRTSAKEPEIPITLEPKDIINQELNIR